MAGKKADEFEDSSKDEGAAGEGAGSFFAGVLPVSPGPRPKRGVVGPTNC